MKRIIYIVSVLMVLVLLSVFMVTPSLAASKGIQDKAIQLTTNPRYDRNPSLLKANNGIYWLFWARGITNPGIRDSYNPDLDYYDVYYKTANSMPGLEKAAEHQIPLMAPDNAQRDIAVVQAADGTIWVFVSTGLGPGADRSVYYYTYDGAWHGPNEVPSTDYAAHISALTYAGKIWVFFDYGYDLKVVSYNETTDTWSATTDIAAGGTVAKAIVDGGKFYIVWTTAGGDGIYLSSSPDGIQWSSTTEPIAFWPGATNWDPVLTADKGVFRLFWAPDSGSAGYGQFIATETSTNPIDVASWSVPVQVTTANYGSANWWDFWPQVYDKGVEYLLYTSERNISGTAMTDGNIWMLHLTVPLLR